MGKVLRKCALCGKFHASYQVVVRGNPRSYCYRCWKTAAEHEIARLAADEGDTRIAPAGEPAGEEVDGSSDKESKG